MKRETISRATAERARREVESECSPELVQERFAREHAKAKRESQKFYSDFPAPPSAITKAALWAIYCGGVADGLYHITEYRPDTEPESKTED